MRNQNSPLRICISILMFSSSCLHHNAMNASSFRFLILHHFILPISTIGSSYIMGVTGHKKTDNFVQPIICFLHPPRKRASKSAKKKSSLQHGVLSDMLLLRMLFGEIRKERPFLRILNRKGRRPRPSVVFASRYLLSLLLQAFNDDELDENLLAQPTRFSTVKDRYAHCKGLSVAGASSRYYNVQVHIPRGSVRLLCSDSILNTLGHCWIG